MRYSVIQTTWKEILMNPGKSTAKKDTQKSRGFSDEEKAAMRERAKELKAEARADKNKAEGESAALAAIAAMPEPDRAIAKRLHAIIKASAPAQIGRASCRERVERAVVIVAVRANRMAKDKSSVPTVNTV